MPDVNRRPTAIAYKVILAALWTPTALGLVRLPGSLADTPGVYGEATAAAVVLGCLISLVGLVWRGEKLTGLTLEQVGLVLICGGSGLYVVALCGVPDLGAALPAMGYVAAFTVGPIVQFVMIVRFRRRRVVQQP
jgi:hypothetical protein